MRRYIAVLLIIIGISLLSYPKLREACYDRQQRKLLEELTQSWGELDEYEDDATVEDTSEEAEDVFEENPDDYLAQYIETHAEGLLKIDKIKLRLPILKGATKKNLDISAASLEGSGKPGEAGNYCISAHRSRSYGRQFNRLDELETGDRVEVIQRDVTYTYEVFEKLVVRAEDTWVLLPRGEEKLLTLITCDYSCKPYPRLIVVGKLFEPPK